MINFINFVVMKEILDFLSDLRANNNREWFHANAERYTSVKEKVNNIVTALIAEVAEVEPEARYMTVRDCTYRIHRDTRFSPDKRPYKTHIGIFINPPYGKKSPMGGYYFHIEPDNCLVAGGNICHPPKVLKDIRESIFDNVDEYLKIIENKEFKSLFETVGDNKLKTTPKGFPKEWEYVDLLRPRDFVVTSPNLTQVFMQEDFIERMRPYIKHMKRYNDFINYVISDYSAEERGL